MNRVVIGARRVVTAASRDCAESATGGGVAATVNVVGVVLAVPVKVPAAGLSVSHDCTVEDVIVNGVPPLVAAEVIETVCAGPGV
jgi:hypothetical protein